MHHDDFQIEPIRGLPETPPEGERILWQGAPDAWLLARDALCLYWVAGYFVLLALWQGLSAEGGFALGLASALPYLILGAIALGILMIIALVLAKTTVYTITTARVAMRIGAALTVTLNIPFSKIASADLAVRRDGSGLIALDLMGNTRISYLVCWPHVRPWKVAPTRPALRSIKDIEAVGEILADAAQTRVNDIAMDKTLQAVPAE